MPWDDRKKVMRRIEQLRDGRTLICFFNFDRQSNPPLPGLTTSFESSTKEPLFRVLKESLRKKTSIDLCLYSRGGDLNAVWPIVSLLREFDQDFDVLLPFRCHSAATMVALGSKEIIMGPLAELSPIDPSAGNQFNPIDELEKNKRKGISVEDLEAYRNFILEQFTGKQKEGSLDFESSLKALGPFLAKLIDNVHPLALGNMHRVQQQIEVLAKKLLGLHSLKGDVKAIIQALTTEFYSHLHMINRHEAQGILGSDKVIHAPDDLSVALDRLLRCYEVDFQLRRTFFASKLLEDNQNKEARFIGGVIESKIWSYLYETKGTLRQHSRIPQGVQIQMPPGQNMPLVAGFQREFQFNAIAEGWIRNTKDPKGVTV